jgi:hypothetical protein
MKRLLVVPFLAALTALAGDVSGTWAGTMEKVKGGPGGPPIEDYHLTLRQTADAIAGTVGPNGADWQIQNARLTGEQLTFETSLAGGKIVVAFNLRVAADEITGTMQSKQGPPIVGKLRFKRTK